MDVAGGRLPSGVDGFELGEPLLFKLATWLIWGPIADGYTVNLHPVAFGAWFGLLATALNLFPIGQFDGGHISYAVLGPQVVAGDARDDRLRRRPHLFLTQLARLDGARDRHAAAVRPPSSADVRRRRAARSARQRLALFAIVMFILCFTPAPIEPLKLLR